NIATLRNVGDALVENLAGGEIRDVAAIEGNRAAAHRKQPEDGFEHCRLAGAIRADHGCDRGTTNTRSRPVENRHLAVAGKTPIQDEQWVRTHFSAPDTLRSRSGCGGFRRARLRR